jgi:peroxiredoxin
MAVTGEMVGAGLKPASVEEKHRWIPFYVLAVAMVIATGFWKIEKSRVEPLRPMDKQAARSPQADNKKAPAKPPMEGLSAPDFTLPTLDGKEMKLSDYRGKIVFLNIWATWCAPCKEEMPSMQKLYELMRGKDFVMLTISIDEKKETVEAFMKDNNLTLPVALDQQQKVSPLYRITGVPETFLIDKNGMVMHHLIGPGDWINPEIVSALVNMSDKPYIKAQAKP